MKLFEISTSAATHNNAIVSSTNAEVTDVLDTTQHSATTSTTALIGLSTISRYSFAASAATRHARTRSGRTGRNRIATSAAAASATPLTRRVIPAVEASLRADDCPGADSAVAALALLIRQHRLDQMAAAEVGPERVGHIDLRVRNLPEQVVAHAHLATGADEEIRIRLTGRVEKAREALLVEILGPHAGLDRTPCSIDNLGAASVVQRDVEEHAGALAGPLDRHVQLVLDVGRQFLHAADHAEADIVAQQRVQLRAEVAFEQTHERTDLARRPLPVLDRERVKRQDADTQARSRFDRITHRVDAGAMTFDAWQVTLRSPSAVAVHDDGDVSRKAVELDLAGQRLVGMSWRYPRQELLKRHDAIPLLANSRYVLRD